MRLTNVPSIILADSGVRYTSADIDITDGITLRITRPSPHQGRSKIDAQYQRKIACQFRTLHLFFLVIFNRNSGPLYVGHCSMWQYFVLTHVKPRMPNHIPFRPCCGKNELDVRITRFDLFFSKWFMTSLPSPGHLSWKPRPLLYHTAGAPKFEGYSVYVVIRNRQIYLKLLAWLMTTNRSDKDWLSWKEYFSRQ